MPRLLPGKHRPGFLDQSKPMPSLALPPLRDNWPPSRPSRHGAAAFLPSGRETGGGMTRAIAPIGISAFILRSKDAPRVRQDRKSDGKGKSVSVRVDPGGCRKMQKK